MKQLTSINITLLFLALLGVGLYLLMLVQLPQIQSQLSSVLQYGLREIAQESTEEINALYAKRIKQYVKQLNRDQTAPPTSSLVERVLILKPDSIEMKWELVALPANVHLEGLPMEQEFSDLISTKLNAIYDHWSERSNSYWTNTLDSTILISSRGSAFTASQRFICQPKFEGGKFAFFWCLLLKPDGLKRNILPAYFEHHFEGEEVHQGIQRSYLNFRVRDERGKLIYNEPILAKGKMEISLSNNKALSFLNGYTIEAGFWAQDSQAIAHSVHRRNQWLLHGLLATFLLLLFYVFRTHQKSRRLDQLKTNFITNISHELKTPLTNIKLVGETLKAARITEMSEAQKQGEIIYRQSIFLENRLNKMLNFTVLSQKGKSNKLDQENLIDAWEFLQHNALEMCQIRSRKLEITGNASGSAMLSLELIWEVLEILIDNGIKYSGPDTSITLNSQIKPKAWEISLIDQGIGISSADQKIVFDKFVRLATPETQTVSGYGIGLASAKQLIELHHGQIKLTSAINKGSRFTIQIPLST